MQHRRRRRETYVFVFLPCRMHHSGGCRLLQCFLASTCKVKKLLKALESEDLVLSLQTWDTMSRVLKLGGPVVAAHPQANATKSAPELTPHMSSKYKSMQNEEDRSATSKGESMSTSQQLSRDCSDHLAGTTDSSICHAHVRVPAAYFNSLHHSSGINFKEWVARNLSQKGSALFVKVFKQLLLGLGGMMKNLPQKSCKDEEEDAVAVVFSKERAVLQLQQDLSLVEVIITAEKGVVIDMEGGIVSSPGVLSIACPARQTQVKSTV